MTPAPSRGLLAFFERIPDPRGHHGRRHSLPAMLAAVTCAVLCGARGFTAAAEWLHAQPPTVWHALGFRRRPPTRNAFRKLLLVLPSEAFEAALRQWIAARHSGRQGAEPPAAVGRQRLCLVLRRHEGAIRLLAGYDRQCGGLFRRLAGTNDGDRAELAAAFWESVLASSPPRGAAHARRRALIARLVAHPTLTPPSPMDDGRSRQSCGKHVSGVLLRQSR